MLIIYINRELTGLSPLARGTPTIFPPFMMKWRFIPAGAGNSAIFTFRIIVKTVYPRWRGELHDKIPCTTSPIGLSPLARGTPYPNPAHITPDRFIPAGAGNSVKRQSGGPTGSVYPRWRGELFSIYQGGDLLFGLSPLARGTRTLPESVPEQRRFIPAGAGNSERELKGPKHNPVYPRWRGELLGTMKSGSFTCGLSPLARGT